MKLRFNAKIGEISEAYLVSESAAETRELWKLYSLNPNSISMMCGGKCKTNPEGKKLIFKCYIKNYDGRWKINQKKKK